LGRIRDISRGGLAFEYVCSEGGREESSAIDIFLSGQGFYLPEIPCKVVYDFHMGADLPSISEFQERRCGVEFGKLTEEQERKLELFFSTYLTGAA